MTKYTFTLLFIFGWCFHAQASLDTNAVKSIKGITDKMLELISGPIDQKRDWEQYRNLFLPTAQKISLRHRNGEDRVRVFNLEEFIRAVGPLYARDGFEEFAIGLSIQEFNGIACVFQSYEAKNLLGTYKARGINSYQLVFQNDRWWIANTLFVAEDPEHLIPETFLDKQ